MVQVVFVWGGGRKKESGSKSSDPDSGPRRCLRWKCVDLGSVRKRHCRLCPYSQQFGLSTFRLITRRMISVVLKYKTWRISRTLDQALTVDLVKWVPLMWRNCTHRQYEPFEYTRVPFFPRPAPPPPPPPFLFYFYIFFSPVLLFV